MALEKDIQTRAGETARYHRIIGHELSFIPERDVPGCKGSVIVHLASYASRAARDANANPVTTNTLRIRFGAEVADNWKGEPVIAIRSDEPTRADIYRALDASPIFAGAVEA